MASSQALLLGCFLLLAMAVGRSYGSWCICKVGPDNVLQSTLDWACANGADCTLIAENGACYNPNSVRDHCSYAVNSYYQKNVQSGATCDFSKTATLSDKDPSSSGCSYPGSASGSAASSTTPGTTPVSGTGGSTSSPVSSGGSTSSSGTGSGLGFGLAPTGLGMNDPTTAGAARLGTAALALGSMVAGTVLLLCN